MPIEQGAGALAGLGEGVDRGELFVLFDQARQLGVRIGGQPGHTCGVPAEGGGDDIAVGAHQRLTSMQSRYSMRSVLTS